MCISMPSPQAPLTSPPVTQNNAQDLQLGSAAIFNKASGIFGRLALTGGKRGAAAQQAAQQQVTAESTPTPTGSTRGSTQGGTLGLPSDYVGRAVFGGTSSPHPVA